MSFVLRIKENNCDPNLGHDWSINSWFMNTFKPGLFLSWTKTPTEGNHGPGPSHSWTTCTGIPSTLFPSKKAALDFWNKYELPDIIPEVLQIELKIV